MPMPARVTRRGALALAALAPLSRPARAAQSRFIQTTDGVRLHVQEAGQGTPIVIVPGWCMPGWLFEPQLRGLSSRFRVVVMDPRGQGQSDIPGWGYDQNRRGADIGDVLDALRIPRAVILGWSLGVLDTLGYVANRGDRGWPD
ncbi:alpha/beta fold hydrolase [Roseomonas sp. CCTCC AB2023176]|uniref:alpha/beta fold hydrolase n=1 Tax=Roseomonas sp. CCTCC AB2023176 TaxID=3342640 RepID=UPI0035DA950E